MMVNKYTWKQNITLSMQIVDKKEPISQFNKFEKDLGVVNLTCDDSRFTSDDSFVDISVFLK